MTKHDSGVLNNEIKRSKLQNRFILGSTDEMVAPANCALSEVIYGFEKVGLGFGETVVIQGAGCVSNIAKASYQYGSQQCNYPQKKNSDLKIPDIGHGA